MYLTSIALHDLENLIFFLPLPLDTMPLNFYIDHERSIIQIHFWLFNSKDINHAKENEHVNSSLEMFSTYFINHLSVANHM